ncbi:hypothetical protein ABKW28_09610 [Nocardioides sp. 31GB23]|uniref:hypothetical protein n=1 Tax=Nocardioides sp. 31GB23 TaxID=3156065 RepID=UPI0032AF018C
MVGPLDEFALHQAPLPVGWAATSDRNFYDRSYFNAHDRSGERLLIMGLGYYPNLGTKDAFVLWRRGDVQTALHLGDPVDDDRLDMHVGPFRIEVPEPLRRLRVVLEETEGLALDLHWTGSFDAVQEQPHVMRSGSRVTLDAQRFAQVGSWEGTMLVDGEEITVSPDTWLGTRDRSWGIRPVGEPEPAGRPADPPFDGMWWTYVPMRFDDFSIVLLMQETPEGHRTFNDCSRIFADGRVEQLGWPLVQVRYASGTRTATGATIRCTRPDGVEVLLEVEARLPTPLHLGGGYGGDSDWSHGLWKGAGFVERLSYDVTTPENAGRAMFGVVDYVGRSTCHEEGRTSEGWGLFEHGAIGRHDRSGFADWFDLAP